MRWLFVAVLFGSGGTVAGFCRNYMLTVRSYFYLMQIYLCLMQLMTRTVIAIAIHHLERRLFLLLQITEQQKKMASKENCTLFRGAL